jgi:drug/metabolite transporter (DMT)-like permease
MRKDKIFNWVLFGVLAIIWGSSFILMKLSREYLTGYQIGAVRILSAGLVFMPFAIFHIRKLPAAKIPVIILSGLMGNFFPAFLFAIAIEKVDSSLEGILNSMTPLFVVIIGILFFKAKVRTKKIAGVLIGFIGLVLLGFSNGFSSSNFGYVLLVVLATVMYGLNVNVVSIYLKGIDPFKMATVSLAAVSIPAFLIALQTGVFPLLKNDEEARWSFLAATMLGIVGSAAATALFYVLIKRAGGLFASLVTYAIPVVAIFWGLLANEAIGIFQIFCLGIILTGVYLGNRN